MIRCGGVPAISRSWKRIEPDVGASVPDNILKIVLLPDPFGPIRPRISPCSTLNETLLTAVKPPKRFTSPLTSSMELRARGCLLQGVRRAVRELEDRFALLLRLGPDDIALVVDILDDDRISALVLARHRLSRTLELDAETE